MAKGDAKRTEQARKTAQADERRRVVLRVYGECDEVVEYALGKLREVGKTPTCAKGCAHCCSLEITVARAEAETIVAWLREHKTAAELDEVRVGLQSWLAWYRSGLRQLVAEGKPRGEAFLKYGPRCVMLAEDGACGIYPVRPIACRSHYVSSPAEACGPTASPGSTVTALTGIVKATSPIAGEIRNVVESQGTNFVATIHVLPEWLAHLLDVEPTPWIR